MKEKVLVLGGGHGQLPLLRKLRKAGMSVILQDAAEECPGRLLSDTFVQADTFDAIAASAAAVSYRVDAVMTSGTDQPVLAAAIAARERGCPGLHSPETARAVTDKEEMKNRLTAAGIPVPGFSVADRLGARPPDRYPVVVKPVDSQGQRGVRRVDRSEDYQPAVEEALKYSRRGRVITEVYHSHNEVTVSGWVYAGRPCIWAVTDRVTRDFPPHIGLCLAHRFPSKYAAGKIDDIHRLTEACVGALGMKEGPLYFQYLLTDDGVLVNECAARLGGAYEDISLPPVCGNDLLGLLIAGSLEGRADPQELRFSTKVYAASFAVPLMFCRPGRIASIEGGRQVRALPGVSAFEFLQAPGTTIRRPTSSVQRSAYMVVHGNSPADVNRILKRAVSRIRIEDQKGRQLLRNPLGYSLNDSQVGTF